ncbi:X8 domain-containing protein [Aspergillus ambiguus]|uniref:X8 domain-containing protein n=1 Tax=Aspergillus ambiguus TaxID=176160 RepID=UPI003CCCB92B
MQQSLTCVVKNTVSEEDFGRLFGIVCGHDTVCDGLARNATTGKFGAYGMCNPRQQLSFVMDQYYKKQSKEHQASACDFNGAASTQKPSKPSGTCYTLLEQALSAGADTMASSPAGGGKGRSSDSAAGLMVSPSGFWYWHNGQPAYFSHWPVFFLVH